MDTLRKQPMSVKIAVGVTVAAGAAAVYVEHERRKKEKTEKTKKKKSKAESSPDKPKKSKKSSSKSPETKRKTKSSSSEKTKTKAESTDQSPAKVEPIAAPAAPELTPEPTVATGNKKVVVLISSYGGNIQIKTNQERAFTILKGMKVEGDQLEIVDGAKAPNREKRNELFGVSGIRAKYPQFFVVDQTDKTHFVANWEDFEAMNDMGCLKQTLNLAA